MKLKAIASEALPAAKPNLALLGKFLLMAVGFILGRRLHVEVDKMVNKPLEQSTVVRFKSLAGTGDYILTWGDTITAIIAFIIYWVTSKKIRILRWFGVGMLLYIVTFESYELIFGKTMGFEVPDISTGGTGTSNTGEDGF